MHAVLAALLLMVLLAACQPTESTSDGITPTSVAPSVQGSVEFISPPAGAVIYAEVIALNGMTRDIPDQTFEIALTGPDGNRIARTQVREAEGSWGSIELLHGYAGEPIEVTVSAYPPGAASSGEYGRTTIILAGLSYRPEGTYGRITFPAKGDTVGGEVIPVSGVLSGTPGHLLTVTLTAEDGRILDTRTTDDGNPYNIDEMPWRADLATNGYVGPARIEVMAEDPNSDTVISLVPVNITIEQAAG